MSDPLAAGGGGEKGGESGLGRQKTKFHRHS